MGAAPKPPARRARTGQPRIRASHSTVAPGSRDARSPAPRREIKPKAAGSSTAGLRKAPLAGPKRAAPRRPTADAAPDRSQDGVPWRGPSSEARDLALALAAAAIDKKAIAIEILDVTGKVDYADYLVVMTGRSDRHVHAIATGIEEAMRRKKLAPLSMEGLSAATWVLIDFGEVVVHVFQEEARALYDIEGLWIDAGRIPVPSDTTPVPPASGPSPRLPVGRDGGDPAVTMGAPPPNPRPGPAG